MARKKLEEVDDRSRNLARLAELVKEWGPEKSKLDKLKKVVDKFGTEIKQLMTKEKLNTCEQNGFIAKITVKHSETFDEPGMIQYIKENIWVDKDNMQCPYINHIEVINWESLEKDMYNGNITKEQVLELDKFKKITETRALGIDYVNKEE